MNNNRVELEAELTEILRVHPMARLATLVSLAIPCLLSHTACELTGCHHPPCPHGVAMNMDDTVMPGHHVEKGCEGELNHPTLVPAHVGG